MPYYIIVILCLIKSKDNNFRNLHHGSWKEILTGHRWGKKIENKKGMYVVHECVLSLAWTRPVFRHVDVMQNTEQFSHTLLKDPCYLMFTLECPTVM